MIGAAKSRIAARHLGLQEVTLAEQMPKVANRRRREPPLQPRRDDERDEAVEAEAAEEAASPASLPKSVDDDAASSDHEEQASDNSSETEQEGESWPSEDAAKSTADNEGSCCVNVKPLEPLAPWSGPSGERAAAGTKGLASRLGKAGRIGRGAPPSLGESGSVAASGGEATCVVTSLSAPPQRVGKLTRCGGSPIDRPMTTPALGAGCREELAAVCTNATC